MYNRFIPYGILFQLKWKGLFEMKKIVKQSLAIPLKGEFASVLVNFIGTCNEDGSPHFCTASWVSFALGPPKSIIFSTFVKPTIENIKRTGEIAINMGTGEMKELSDTIYGIMEEGKQDKLPDYEWGKKLHVPILDASPYVVECKVIESHVFGDSIIFFAEIINQQIDVKIGKPENDTDEAYVKWTESLNVNDLNPLLWLGNYHYIGNKIL